MPGFIYNYFTLNAISAFGKSTNYTVSRIGSGFSINMPAKIEAKSVSGL